MDYQQVKEQQKVKFAEETKPSVSLDDSVVGDSEASEISGNGTGNFMADLNAAVDAYVSGKNAAAEIDSTIAAIDKKNAQRGWFNKTFHNIFYGAKDQQEREALEAQRDEHSASAGNALMQFSDLMNASTKANIDEMIADENIVRRIMTSLPEENVKSTLDNIYTELDDDHLDLMMDMIYIRFGVPVVDGSDERFSRVPYYVKRYFDNAKARPWTAEALKHVYQVYLLLPKDHLKVVTCLAHIHDRGPSGAALGETGIYYVNYLKGAEDQLEFYDPSWSGTVGHCDSANDMRCDTQYLNTTLAHELGHVLDAKNNKYGYSRSESFRKCSEWVEIDNDPDMVVQFMADSLKFEPFNNDFAFYEEANKLTDEEKKKINDLGRKLTFDIGKKVVQLSPQTWADTQSLIDTEVKAVPGLTEYEQKRYLLRLKNELYETNLVYHLWLGLADNSSWYNHKEEMKGMKRPFHQGYKGASWYSFNNDKWANKISCYQYRDPREEFAETYASYHTAPLAEPREVVNPDGTKVMVPYKKGEKTPEPLRKWFENEGLHRMEPDSISGSADVTKEDDKRRD